MSAKQPPKLRPNRWDICVAAAILLLAGICAAAVWGRAGGDGTVTAVVSVEGAETERFPLTETGTRTYTNNGYTLRVQTAEKDGAVGIEVAEADCPTQDCVHTGRVFRAGQSIVCLPARISIRLVGDAGDENAVDAVIG